MKIAFFKGSGSIYDKLIRFWTWGPYSHCETVFSDGITFGNRMYGDFAVREELNQHPPEMWDFIEISNEKELEGRKFANSIVGAKYDWLGIFFTQIFPLRIDNKNKYYCSEVCMVLLQKMGMFTDQRRGISPNKLYRLLKGLK